jgi:hypothetical protein
MVHLLWGNVREAGFEGSFLDRLFFFLELLYYEFEASIIG